jgi:hypothetical protein
MRFRRTSPTELLIEHLSSVALHPPGITSGCEAHRRLLSEVHAGSIGFRLIQRIITARLRAFVEDFVNGLLIADYGQATQDFEQSL